MTMRVAIITNNYTPYRGGVVSAINVLVTELQRSNIPVIIITFDFARSNQDPPWVYRLSSPWHFSYRHNAMIVPWRMRQQMAAIFAAFQPTIVHLHHPFLLGVVARDIARKENIPCIFTYHSQYAAFAHFFPLLPAALVRRIIHYYVDTFIASIDSLIVPTPSIASQLQQRGIKTAMMIMPTPMQEIFSTIQPTTKQLHARISLLIVTRFTPEKNIWPLLDLIAAHPDFQLTIAGYGELQEELERYALVHHRIMPERLRFVIAPSPTELVQLYQQADIFVFTSLAETQGLVLAESMAGGSPVVALRAPGAQDIIIDGYNGFLVDTMAQMAERIQQIINHPELYQQLVAGAYATARRYHAGDWRERLLHCYQSIQQKKVPHSMAPFSHNY
ncbi:glycosyltransferase [Candidatus Dependentiae bacterium]|nr:glycosyltransferase [Candidatus Dependentiae bacterium]